MSEFMEKLLQEDNNNEAWRITDDKSADWAMRKILDAREDTRRWQDYYQQQLDKITAANGATEEFFASRLREYFDTVPHHETSTQSKYKLPSGELIFKKRDPEYKIIDQAAATDWLEANGRQDYVEVKKSVRWKELKKAVTVIGNAVFDSDGEQVPGIQVTERDPEFVVNVK